jgi:hypothetical protein
MNDSLQCILLEVTTVDIHSLIGKIIGSSFGNNQQPLVFDPTWAPMVLRFRLEFKVKFCKQLYKKLLISLKYKTFMNTHKMPWTYIWLILHNLTCRIWHINCWHRNWSLAILKAWLMPAFFFWIKNGGKSIGRCK